MKNPKDKEKAKQLESVMKESLEKTKETLENTRISNHVRV